MGGHFLSEVDYRLFSFFRLLFASTVFHFPFHVLIIAQSWTELTSAGKKKKSGHEWANDNWISGPREKNPPMNVEEYDRMVGGDMNNQLHVMGCGINKRWP